MIVEQRAGESTDMPSPTRSPPGVTRQGPRTGNEGQGSGKKKRGQPKIAKIQAFGKPTSAYATGGSDAPIVDEIKQNLVDTGYVAESIKYVTEPAQVVYKRPNGTYAKQSLNPDLIDVETVETALERAGAPPAPPVRIGEKIQASLAIKPRLRIVKKRLVDPERAFSSRRGAPVTPDQLASLLCDDHQGFAKLVSTAVTRCMANDFSVQATAIKISKSGRIFVNVVGKGKGGDGVGTSLGSISARRILSYVPRPYRKKIRNLLMYTLGGYAVTGLNADSAVSIAARATINGAKAFQRPKIDVDAWGSVTSGVKTQVSKAADKTAARIIDRRTKLANQTYKPAFLALYKPGDE